MYITDSQNSPLKNISDINGQLAYRGQVISGSAGTGSSQPSLLNATQLINSFNPIAFYKADQAYNFSGNLVSNGDKVWKWKDLTNNHLDMFAISGEAYAPTYYNTGYLGYPGLRFGESNGTFLECRSGIFNLKEHTIISVSKSNASTQFYGRLLILGIPLIGDDYNIAYGQVLTFDNDGSRSFRVNAGNANYELYIATSVLEQVPTGIFSYRISTKKTLAMPKLRLADQF